MGRRHWDILILSQGNPNLRKNLIFRFFGVLIIEDNEKARFPANDLKEFHGVVSHEVTFAETLLFCIREDGTEGLCCPTGGEREDDEEDDDS